MTQDPFSDVVIIGGGAAGSSAALVLGRARARVAVVDARQPSNAPSTGIGGLLGNDGTTPADFYQRAADDIAAYPTVTRRSASVTAIHRNDTPQWHVELDDGGALHTDRLLLATGMRYAVPDIDGIEGRWGSSVFHCPFCHGWEHLDQPLAVLGGAPMTIERTLLLRRWTDDLTLISGSTVLTDSERLRLESAGVRIINGDIASLHGEARRLDAITLADGTSIVATGLLVPAPHQHRDRSLLGELGLDTTPTGHLVTDAFGMTSVPGIWAAGDLTSPIANVARAIAEGANCAIAITHHLVVAEHGLDPAPRPPASQDPR
ncbi:MAG: NAD(P)/FAD-dependent oxidoreductase [Actinomycetota bacterium]|nr:NAD(P)/FAD-dependent oxidoreductase [Actinomycetota bacterium]